MDEEKRRTFMTEHSKCQTGPKIKLPDGMTVSLGPGYEERFYGTVDQTIEYGIRCKGCGAKADITKR